MSKIEDALKGMIVYRSKQIAKQLLGDLPSQCRQAQKDIRALKKTIAQLSKQVASLTEIAREAAPISPAPEAEVEKARFTKRTLPAIRREFDLTQQELAKLLEVAPITVSSWERGKTKPTGENLAKIVALRSMKQEEVDAALDRQPVSAAMNPQEIKALRKKLGVNQGKMAGMLGVSVASIVGWEAGRTVPSGKNAQKLSELAETEAAQKETPEEPVQKEEPAAEVEMSAEGIKQLRQDMGLSQKKFAEKLGVSANTIGSWESGSTAPTSKNVQRLLHLAPKTEGKKAPAEPAKKETPAAQTELSADEIRQIRKDGGMSQRGLAEKLGVSANSVWNWESGRTKPRDDTVQKLLKMRK